MRSLRTTLLMCALLPVAAHAQPPAGNSQTCVDVAVGSAQSYNCLNATLGTVASEAHHSSAAIDAPASANSPSNVTGQFNESATRNRLGANFGRSVTPQRPAYNPPAAFASPR